MLQKGQNDRIKNIVSVFYDIQCSLKNFELSATIMKNSSPYHNTSASITVGLAHTLLRKKFPTPLVHTITSIAKTPTIVNASFKSKIFLYDKGNYESYKNLLSVVDQDGIFKNDDIDLIANTITNTILDAANKTIPNRYITVKKDNPPWITTKIKKSTYAVKMEFTKK